MTMNFGFGFEGPIYEQFTAGEMIKCWLFQTSFSWAISHLAVEHSQPLLTMWMNALISCQITYALNAKWITLKYSFRCPWNSYPHRRRSPVHHRSDSSTVPVSLCQLIEQKKNERHNNRIQGNEHNLIVDQFTSIPTAAMRWPLPSTSYR